MGCSSSTEGEEEPKSTSPDTAVTQISTPLRDVQVGKPFPCVEPAGLFGEMRFSISPLTWDSQNLVKWAIFRYNTDTTPLHDCTTIQLLGDATSTFVQPIVQPAASVLESLIDVVLQGYLVDHENQVIGSFDIPLNTLAPGITMEATFTAQSSNQPLGPVEARIELFLYEHSPRLPRLLVMTPPPSSPTPKSPSSGPPVAHIITGLQTTPAVEHSADTLAEADFTSAAAGHRLISVGQETCEMKDFAPKVFHMIRLLAGVTESEYIEAWKLPEEKMQASLGAGRSGSLFLSSNDNRFLLKTIPAAEAHLLLEILQPYYEHIFNHKDSLIQRILGLHRISSGLTKTYFIVFSSVLWTSYAAHWQAEVFDLKGRVTKPGKLCVRRGQQGIVWKDKDLERFFFLPEPTREKFLHQLTLDVDFLQFHNIMDYSLLVGVRLRTGNEQSPPCGPYESFFHSQLGGVLGNTGQEVYFLGIIDCLTTYSSKKKVANFCKQRLWEGPQLSTLPSADYADRFKKYFTKIFPSGQEALSPELQKTHPNYPFPPQTTQGASLSSPNSSAISSPPVLASPSANRPSL